MKLNKPKNSNYCATVIKVNALHTLEGLDNLLGTWIQGNHVLVSKDLKVGELQLYFPAECQLSHEYLHENSLYREKTLNKDQEKKGYFEDNRRIKTLTFKGHKSQGILMPLSSLESFTKDFSTIQENSEFDELNGKEICKKYVPKITRTPGEPGSHDAKRKKKLKKISKIVENQFRFHYDTSHLGKNMHFINPDDVVTISYKVHGTSGISAYVLCKRNLKWYEKLLKKIGVNIPELDYDYIYSSRGVIKNDDLNTSSGWYGEKNDVWKHADEIVRPHLLKGMTMYYEIVGFVPTGGYIQKEYDYGFKASSGSEYKYGFNFGIQIYRITITTPEGQVIEFSPIQVATYCHQHGLNHVSTLMYDKARNIVPMEDSVEEDVYSWRERFLKFVVDSVNSIGNCTLCNNKVPAEGWVLRKDVGSYAFKVKAFDFLKKESKQLDSGVIDIESEQTAE